MSDAKKITFAFLLIISLILLIIGIIHLEIGMIILGGLLSSALIITFLDQMKKGKR
jgi:hypothetical protein